MNVAIRADASLVIGSGHVMRCLTLAEVLRTHGAKTIFVCREHVGHLCEVISARGFAVLRLPVREVVIAESAPSHWSWLAASWRDDAGDTVAALEVSGFKPDWIVADHYGLDYRWEGTMREAARRVAVVDDLADRLHDCDLLLDQNLLPGYATRYDSLVPHQCTKLLGPNFILLRSEFQNGRRDRQAWDGVIRRALVFFGSADAGNYTSGAVDVIGQMGWTGLELSVVTGKSNPHWQDVDKSCALVPRCEHYRATDKMATLMADADVAIGAAGFTSYEMAYMELPSVLFPRSPVQELVSSEIAAHGAAINLGWQARFPHEHFIRALDALRSSPTRCKEMAQAGGRLFDGRGAERVAQALTQG